MFNSYNYKSETKVCPVTRVVEKTITPDKVVDMYNKVEREFQQSILARYDIKNTIIDAKVTVYQDANTAMYVARVTIEINGNRMEENVAIDILHVNDKGAILKVYYEAVSKMVTNMLMSKTAEVILHPSKRIYD